MHATAYIHGEARRHLPRFWFFFLATLAAMYIGYSFFGFAGILLLPLVVIILGIYKNDSSKVKKSTAT